ncbi:MAG: hypothetical protein LIO44_00155, partial [Eubacterium sp.]|nr:hypothetical protein [Eubacterium sp.]
INLSKNPLYLLGLFFHSPSVNGNIRTVSASNGVYTISGNEVTGAVSIYYDSSDMAVYTFYVDDADAEKGSLTGSTAFILSSGGSLTETQVNSIGISEGTGYTFDHWEVTKEGDVITASVSLADLANDVLSGSALEVVSADLAEETYVGRTYTNDALLSLTADRNLTFKAVFELTDFNVTDENGKAVISSGLTNGYAHMGDDLVFSFNSGIVYYAAYKIGDGTETVLTGTADSKGNFTIPGSVITDDVTIITKTSGSEYELISHDNYLGEKITAGDGKQIVLIETSKLDSGNFALTDGSEFFYSESYGAYVMWVDESETVKTINGKLTTSANEVSDVDYTGDINGTGVVTAGDAGMINDILENNWSYEVTDAQLFSLDVDQAESPKQVYTSDIVWVLEESIGLTH